MNIDTGTWETLAADRAGWRQAVSNGMYLAEANKRTRAEEKREKRKCANSAPFTTKQNLATGLFVCDTCGRTFGARIGLIGHKKGARNCGRRGHLQK